MGKIGGVVSPLTMKTENGLFVLTAASNPAFRKEFATEQEARDWAKHSNLTIA